MLTRPVMMAFMSGLFDFHQQNLFVRKSVAELMFDGYRLDFFDTLQTLARPFEALGYKFPLTKGFPNKRFGIYLGRNNTALGPFQVYTGVDETFKKTAQLISWHNKTSIDFWYGGHCSELRGTDGTRLSPFLDPAEDVYVFSNDACRSVRMRYVRSTTVADIPVNRYELISEQFLRPQLNPDNWCYCVNRSRAARQEVDGDGRCSVSGLLDLSKCWFGAPLYASKPHFLSVDDSWINVTIKDMRPDPAIHESFIHVEPVRFLIGQKTWLIESGYKLK